MKKIEIFEPAMCCSTGLCGPSIDPELLRVSSVVSSLAEQGVDIKRFNLSSNPQEFVTNNLINECLAKDGVDVLPVTLVEGEIVKTKAYPSDIELATWSGASIPKSEPEKKESSDCCGGSGCC